MQHSLSREVGMQFDVRLRRARRTLQSKAAEDCVVEPTLHLELGRSLSTMGLKLKNLVVIPELARAMAA